MKKQLHAAGAGTHCRSHPSGNKQSGWHSGLLPILSDLAGLRALIYSGDHDLCVPHTGSEAWTSAMHRSDSEECNLADEGADDSQLAKCDGVVNPWQPWYNSDSPKQVGHGHPRGVGRLGLTLGFKVIV